MRYSLTPTKRAEARRKLLDAGLSMRDADRLLRAGSTLLRLGIAELSRPRSVFEEGQEERAQDRVRAIVTRYPTIAGVRLDGDPRGRVLRLRLRHGLTGEDIPGDDFGDPRWLCL